MKTVCFGLLIVFFCNDSKPVVVSDFCRGTRAEIEKLRGLTDAEIAALTRPRKEAIRSLREKYKANCK